MPRIPRTRNVSLYFSNLFDFAGAHLVSGIYSPVSGFKLRHQRSGIELFHASESLGIPSSSSSPTSLAVNSCLLLKWVVVLFFALTFSSSYPENNKKSHKFTGWPRDSVLNPCITSSSSCSAVDCIIHTDDGAKRRPRYSWLKASRISSPGRLLVLLLLLVHQTASRLYQRFCLSQGLLYYEMSLSWLGGLG